MALYTNDSKERVRDAVDMVDLVSSRVELKRAGANRLTGLCPFHDERTPSFGINPAEKVYHCFGCQASGDAFTFVMETEGVDFKGALEHLADRYKVTLELEDEDPQAAEQRKRRERLLELLERTATYYVRQLWESQEAAKAREYLASRGLQEATLREFRVGYAPSAWDTVLNASRRAGFGNRELYDAGLAQRSQANSRIYDRFRSQIIFPLADPRGRVRGFAGRTLGGDAGDRRPKYVNSPESELFHKGRTLFAADLARGAGGEGAERGRGRGLHRCHRDAPGRRAQRRRHHGHRADRGPDRRARAAGARGEARAGRRQRRQGGDAARRARSPPGASRRCACAWSALPPGDDPADLVQREGGEAIARLVEAAVPFARFRVLRRLETRRPRDRRGPRPRARRSCARTSRCSSPAPSARSSRGSRRRAWTCRPSCSSRCWRAAPARAAGPRRGGRRRPRPGARRSSVAAIRPSARFSRCASRCRSSARRRSPSSIRRPT